MEAVAEPPAADSPVDETVESPAPAKEEGKDVTPEGTEAEAAAEPAATGALELEKAEAIRLACAWYDSDQGPFVGEYTIATPVLGAYFNNSSGSDACEWSLRYYVAPSTGEEVSLSPF